MLRIAKEALTFDDVLLVPGHSTVLPHEADLKTRLTRNIELNIPMVSSAMDTVTESRLAIALAQEGGLGFIHKNMSIEAQANEVRRVKKYESGIVSDPVTVPDTVTVGDVMRLADEHGFSGFPVVDSENNLVGIVTGRDLRFETNLDAAVTTVMTPKDKLVTVTADAERETVLGLMHEHRIEKLLVVNDERHCVGLITVKVKNFDKTITTIPTHALTSGSFKNWRDMYHSGGRRIKRAIQIDVSSIGFCTGEQIDSFNQIHLLKDYLAQKHEQLTTSNRAAGVCEADKLNSRQLTNIGTFRAYIEAYLKQHAKVHKQMTCMVRQLPDTGTGLPLELYFFTTDPVWVNYETIQADIFDHIYAMAPHFGLRIFQHPGGFDCQPGMAPVHGQI